LLGEDIERKRGGSYKDESTAHLAQIQFDPTVPEDDATNDNNTALNFSISDNTCDDF